MYKKFEQALKKRGVTIYRVAKDTGVTMGVIYNWKNGKTVPRAETLKALADYVGIGVGELIGG